MSNRRVHIALALAALTFSLVAASGAAVGASRGKRVVATRYSASLERKVLTTTAGMTLYSLKIERHGKFACTGTCLGLWHPLLIGAGTRPTGPVKLGAVKRPDSGKTQVAYNGMPLYTYGGDGSPGQVNGNGITDVGRWHAATPPAS